MEKAEASGNIGVRVEIDGGSSSSRDVIVEDEVEEIEKKRKNNPPTRRKRRKSSFSFTHKKRSRKTMEPDVVDSAADLAKEKKGDDGGGAAAAAAEHKKKMTKKASKAQIAEIESFEDRVLKGKFTAADVRKVKIELREYTDRPLHPRMEAHMKTEEFRKMRENPEHIRLRAPEKDCKELHYITRYEMKFYREAVRRSEGFDLPFLPFTIMRGGMRAPVNFGFHEDKARHITKYSKLSLLHYNKINGTDFVLDKVEKANVGSACYLMYHISFYAKSAANPTNPTVDFQARVHEGLKGDVTIRLCRVRAEMKDRDFC